jgi:hypothetical protein
MCLMKEPDVIVAGGGAAGLAAAIAAARSGAETLLIERTGALGGMVSAALVHSICGLYPLASKGHEPLPFANPFFPAEFAARLCRAGGANGPHRMGRVDVLLQHPTAFARLADEIAGETAKLRVRLHTEVIAVAGDFQSLEMCCRGRRETVRARAMVDATGDALVAELGRASVEQAPANRLQRPAFIYALHGVDPSAVGDDARIGIAAQLATAVRQGHLPPGTLGAAFRTSRRGSEVFVTIDLDCASYDPLDPDCLTALEQQGRELAVRLSHFLRTDVRGFQQSFISAFPARVGVRESRCLLADYMLEAADLKRSAEFADAIALATWPMELRETARGPRLRFPDDERPCDIPLRSLRARGHANLFAAGRCIGATHEAQASIRVIGTCLATGEAAGIAAALHATRSSVDAEMVRAMREKISR